MKKVIVFFLLFIFTIQSTKSLWIITSFEINRDYIASKLCINRFDKIPTCKGQCVLEKQLDKQEKENKNNGTVSEKYSIFIAPDFAEVKIATFPSMHSKNKFSFLKIAPYTSFLFSFENPPELVS